MIAPKYNNNLWTNTAATPLALDAFTGELNVDLIIIGGGFTGCAAALEAVQRGLSVVLLEAQSIGFGGSGRNVGLVNAGLWTPPDDVESTLGHAAGQKLNAALASAPDLVFSLIEKHQINCDAVRNGTLHCAHSSTGLKDLHSRFTQQKKRNAPVELINRDATCQRTGSDTFEGALFDPRAGTIQPLSYCQGLAQAAITKGAKLFENSPALSIERQLEQWQVKTQNGMATAPNLIVATNAYSNDQLLGQQARFTLVHYFQFATEPLTDKERETVLPNLEGCWDTALVMSSFRYDRDGRLLVGSVGSLDHAASATHEFWAQKKLAAIYPQLAHKKLDHAWHGRIAMTHDHLPKLVEFGPNAYSVFGYSGRGIGPGTVFGTSLAQMIATGDKTHLPMPPMSEYSEQFTKVAGLYYETGSVLTHASFAAGRSLIGR
ncbi:FAD-binding oxidoreductase [uncultured Maritalea sp.]|jgi:glycine/D-amino acid oxidase-like deaminating enzyme|uniref:NAD(P)/FAD-dependent oxidoreductase n=1 Tax=uncultured Maritalea sp. TaxID=757249 RepID=UPI0026310549|nr:FAD-binding oxidoreductase [uncultured Maritalea sp.]